MLMTGVVGGPWVESKARRTVFSFGKQPETDTDSLSSLLLFRLGIRPFQLRMIEILVSLT